MREQIGFRSIPPRAHATGEYRQAITSTVAVRDTDEEYELPRMPVVVKKYHQPQSVRVVVADRRKRQMFQPENPRQQTAHHPVVYFLLGMLVLALALLLANMFLAHLAGVTC